MPIVQSGSINTTALVVPDLYVQIVTPQNLVLNGVPSNVIGMVGTASWGPVGAPIVIGNLTDYVRWFGPVQNRKYDMGTHVNTAVQQGANAFRCVRVTDGTDGAAAITVQTNCITFTAYYTGSTGNTIQIGIANGSKANTFRVTVALPGFTPEQFDNIPGSGNTFWVNVANAINNGNSVIRGASSLVTASAGIGTSAPTLTGTSPYVLVGGSDGVSSVTAATLIGVDTVPRKGMYALRNQGCSVGMLADADDSTQWTTQASFGLSEGIYMILTGPSGDTIANATSTKQSAGLDSYACKLMFGDWIYWNDQTNNVVRLVSPQGFVAGRLGNLSPEQSSLNKQLYSVVGSQKSGQFSRLFSTYASADLAALFQVGIDVIANPEPGGYYWGVRAGQNSSSNAAINGDNYTRMTNYIASTLNSGMGLFVGLPINSTLMQQVRATLLSFLNNMLQQNMLANLPNGAPPFSVVCDSTNNPFSRTSLGYLQADVQVQYMAINRFFIVNLEGGQTVNVNSQIIPSGSITT